MTAVGSADAVVTSSGHTTEVDVAMHDMRFVPDRIDVPTGDTLVIRVTNHDDQEHDLVLESGQRTPDHPATPRPSPWTQCPLTWPAGAPSRATGGWE